MKDNMGASQAVEWRRLTLAPYRAYEVSADGRIRRDGRELKGYVDRYGYRSLLLSYAGIPKRHKVHRLVCETFHGSGLPGQEVCHLDGDSQNNAASNLMWGSRSENVQHALAHGTHRPGRPLTKLDECKVREIRRKVAAGESERTIAAEYGISAGQVHKIKIREVWANVE